MQTINRYARIFVTFIVALTIVFAAAEASAQKIRRSPAQPAATAPAQTPAAPVHDAATPKDPKEAPDVAEPPPPTLEERVEDIQDRTRTLDTIFKKDGRLGEMFNNIQSAVFDAEGQTLIAKVADSRRELNSLRQSVNWMHTKNNWGTGILMVLMVILGFLIVKAGRMNVRLANQVAALNHQITEIAERDAPPSDDPLRGTRRVTPHAIVFLAIGLGFASSAQAQNAPEPTCLVRSISVNSPTGMVVKDDDPKNETKVIVTFSKCEKVANIAAEQGITFSDVKVSGSRVTAKVAADTTVAAGAYGINLLDDQGNPIAQKDSQEYMAIIGEEAAIVRRKNIAENKQLAATVATANKNVDGVKLDIKAMQAVVANLPTAQQLREAVEPLDNRIANLEKAMAGLAPRVAATEKNVDAHTDMMMVLASGQEKIAGEEVKKGFFGKKKPVHEGAAKDADRVQQVLERLEKLQKQ